MLNDTQYLYITNNSADVMAIADSTGSIIAKYSYDEWGKFNKAVDSNGIEITDVNNVALINPIRYRGYYYDSETGYYYLQSRYYDPTICRFINADLPGYASEQKDETAGINIFVYCCNEPVWNSDNNGYKSTSTDLLEGYNSSKSAVKAFAKKNYNTSYYIQHEIFAAIYLYYENRQEKYGVTGYMFGNPHNCIEPLETCKKLRRHKNSVIIAIVHTHVCLGDLSGLSEADMRYAQENKINIYSIGSNKSVYYYHYNSVIGDQTEILKKLYFRKIRTKEKNILKTAFYEKWQNHCEECKRRCREIKWPRTPQK